MGFLITTLILFAFTLLVPGLASQDETDDVIDAAKAARRKELAEATRLLAEQTEDLLEKTRLQRQAAVELAQAELDIARAIGTSSEELVPYLQAVTDATQFQKEFADGLKEATDKVKAQEKAHKDYAESFQKDLSNMLGMQAKFEDTLLGGFAKFVGGADSFGKALSNLTKGFSFVDVAARASSATIGKFVEATTAVAGAQDDAISSFIRTTGANEELAESISDVFFNTRTMGVTMGEAGAAAESLYTNMAIFSRQNRETREELVRSVALMGEFGISNDVASESLDVMTRVLGMNAMEAAATSEQMANFAESIGVPPARLMQELSATAPSLAQFGNRATDVLMDLTSVAKATGIELNALVGIADRFDTFDGAAEAAGRLNSILGGPFLNSVELLTAEPADKIRQLGEAIMRTGRSFEDLTRFERQAIASAAGISNLSDASAIFSGNLEQNIAELQVNNEEMRTMEERAQLAQSFTDQIVISLQSFAAEVRPLTNLLKGFLQGIATVANFLSTNAVAGVTVLVVSLSAMVAGMRRVINSTRAAFASVSSFTAALEANTQAAIRNAAANTATGGVPGGGGPSPSPAPPAARRGLLRGLVGGAGALIGGPLGLGLLVAGVAGTMLMANRAEAAEASPAGGGRFENAALNAAANDTASAASMLRTSASLTSRAATLQATRTRRNDVSEAIRQMNDNNQKQMNRLEQIATRPFNVKLKGREVGRFVKDDVFNKGGMGGFDVA